MVAPNIRPKISAGLSIAGIGQPADSSPNKFGTTATKNSINVERNFFLLKPDSYRSNTPQASAGQTYSPDNRHHIVTLKSCVNRKPWCLVAGNFFCRPTKRWTLVAASTQWQHLTAPGLFNSNELLYVN